MHTLYIDSQEIATAQEPSRKQFEKYGPEVYPYDAEMVAVVFPEQDTDEPTADPTAPEVWANSAGIRIKEDAVQVWVSVGDPRGAFQMELRKAPDGRIVIHTPHPDESGPHMDTENLHPGTLVITATKPREEN